MKNPLKYWILPAAVVLGVSASLNAQADVISIGPRAGVNFANVSNLEDTKSHIGLVAGATGTYSISEDFGITLDILYSQEGYESDQGDVVNLDYLQIPLYFNVFFSDLGEAFRPKVYAGVAPGFLLNAESGDVDISDSITGFNFSLSGGLGFNYRLAQRVWLNADLRTFLGLSDIRDEAFRDGDSVSSRNLQVTAGVAFGLSKLD